MRFKKCIICNAELDKETKIGDFCTKKCVIKYYKKHINKKIVSKDIQKLIISIQTTPNWHKLMEDDVKAKKKADERGDQRRRGIN